MPTGQFRFAYFTACYDETIDFYLRVLALPLIEAWDRSQDDRGTLIGAAGGIIEVLARPAGGSEHFFDRRPPQGAFMVIEVEQIEELYERVREYDVPIQDDLVNRSWGHRSFCVREPNGLTIYFFSSLVSSI